MNTGKFDRKGRPLFVGNYVIMPWFFFNYNGSTYPACAIHKLKYRQAFESSDYIICLGDSDDSWEGKEATLITHEERQQINIEDGVFFFIDEGVYTVITKDHIPVMKGKTLKETMFLRSYAFRDFFYNQIRKRKASLKQVA